MAKCEQLTPLPFKGLSFCFVLLDVLADIWQQYVGCYRDDGTFRAMTGTRPYYDGSMTHDLCLHFCQLQSNYSYFGLRVQLGHSARVTATLE